MSYERDRGSADWSSGRNTNLAEAYRIDRSRPSAPLSSSSYSGSHFSWGSSSGAFAARQASKSSARSGGGFWWLFWGLVLAIVALIFSNRRSTPPTQSQS